MADNIYGEYFCGNKISEYGLKHGYLDWATFAKAFDAVMNNDIIQNLQNAGFYDWDLEVGSDVHYEDYDGNEISEEEYYENGGDEIYDEVYQYFIVSDQGAELIKEYEVGILWYNEELDMYVWGVTHWGTSWDYVLTDVKCNVGMEA